MSTTTKGDIRVTREGAALRIVCHFTERAIIARHFDGTLVSLPDVDLAFSDDASPSLAGFYETEWAAADAAGVPRVLFVHQDIGLTPAFLGRLGAQIAALEALDPTWGVAGVWGTFLDQTTGAQRYAGLIRDTFALRRGDTPSLPFPVTTVDGCCFIVSQRARMAGLAFDPTIPGYAGGYSEDLCLRSARLGLGVYALHAYVEHWCDRTDTDRDPAFLAAAAHVARAWAPRPVLSSVGVFRP